MFSDTSKTTSTETTIPPEIYDIAFGWDPAPEIQRLLYLCREASVEPRSALELGCGTGRLMHALRPHISELHGLDLSPRMVTYATERFTSREDTLTPPANIFVADMSDFKLNRTFDLIYASANTLRWVCHPESVTSLWHCVARHLRPGGMFIADLELGIAEETGKVGKPAAWTLSRGETLVRTSWTVIEPPSLATSCCTVEWVFEVKRGRPRGCWRETFNLRTYNADEFLRLAIAEDLLEPRGCYLLRDPYLFETPTDRAVGRMLVAFRRA